MSDETTVYYLPAILMPMIGGFAKIIRRRQAAARSA
jgi:hypothetical protein